MNQHSVQNVAPPLPPRAFEIVPTQGEIILLYGWLRTYAQYEMQWVRDKLPFPNATDSIHIRQEIYESTDGQWLFVETLVDGDVAITRGRECLTWQYSNKEAIRAPFRFNDHVRELFAQCDLPYLVTIGQPVGGEV
ncbi:hypothetical protein LQM11_003991 [Vibrio parahaemolyticus]|nr:hypothetical protein [Vibrio parahaemolyticus]